ncbi:vacuolar protein sorting-associated protein 37C-like [Xenia sp. Carnegie-2017]|uniref:vacuolar protein sorting-associated protein 37C-like n=1 Tax=Xenia sp. Carnegie-2017 TaxID=2897299 RepID=UPI001F0475D2|nr:vacuolar protein sorting-associated protein 37C-like [Xenia sp. Carnegie-2017]
MNQGYSYGGMPVPYRNQTASQSYNVGFNGLNSTGNFNNRSQMENVMYAISNQLDQLDQAELQELHDKEEKLHQFLNENNEVKKIQTEREMNTMSNRSLAEYNLRQGERLAECKSRLVHLYEELNKQTKIFDENKSNLETLSEHYNPDTLLALLQTSVAQLEEHSEEIAEKFLEGDVAIEDFLEKYGEERQMVHIKRTKVDKLRELIRNSNTSL